MNTFKDNRARETMSSTKTASSTTAPTEFLQVNGQSYAYRRFGNRRSF